LDEQEFLEGMAVSRGAAAHRIYGLLSGTNHEDDNVLQILDHLVLRARHHALDGIRFPESSIVPDEDEDEFKLGPCGCTDYHMADCPLMTGG
jgi:hypothetical protein